MKELCINDLTRTLIELMGKKKLKVEFVNFHSYRYYKDDVKPAIEEEITRMNIIINTVGFLFPFDFMGAWDKKGTRYNSNYFRIKDYLELRNVLNGEADRILPHGIAREVFQNDKLEDYPMLLLDYEIVAGREDILNKLHKLRSPDNPLTYRFYGGM